MNSQPPSKALSTYIGVVCAAGVAALGVGLCHGAHELTARLTAFAVMTPFVVAGELFPIRVPRGEELREVRTSITFAFATMLMAGPAAALIAMTLAVTARGLQRRWSARDVAFVASVNSLALWCAAAVLAEFNVSAPAHDAVRIGDVGAFAVAGFSF